MGRASSSTLETLTHALRRPSSPSLPLAYQRGPLPCHGSTVRVGPFCCTRRAHHGAQRSLACRSSHTGTLPRSASAHASSRLRRTHSCSALAHTKHRHHRSVHWLRVRMAAETLHCSEPGCGDHTGAAPVCTSRCLSHVHRNASSRGHFTPPLARSRHVTSRGTLQRRGGRLLPPVRCSPVCHRAAHCRSLIHNHLEPRSNVPSDHRPHCTPI